MAIGLKGRKRFKYRLPGERRTKYANKTKVLDAWKFDSEREAKRYQELKLLEKAKQINSLAVHPMYAIVWPKTDIVICKVELDFSYFDKQGDYHVVDVKGADTALSRLKRKLVEAAHGITVEIVK